MKISLSPYELCNEALRLIDAYDEISYETEKQILLLLNKAELYPNISTYQLSLARKKLAEYYMNHGITGSALEQYQIALSENPRLPIKKIVKSLINIPSSDLIYSIDSNITGEPDTSIIEKKLMDSFGILIDQNTENLKDLKKAALYGMNVDEYRKWNRELRENTIREMQMAAAEEDAIYDPEFEDYINNQLDLLGEDYRKSFFDFLTRRKLDDTEPIDSYKTWARKTLESFWDSKNAADYHLEQLSKASNLRISKNNLPSVPLTSVEMLFLQYMHHKKTTLETIAGYWTHQYHLDYATVLTKLITLNYLGYANLEYSLKKLKVSDLTKILNQLGLDVTGKKNDLISKILPHEKSDYVLPYSKSYYEVTNAGKQFLSEQEYDGKDLSFRF